MQADPLGRAPCEYRESTDDACMQTPATPTSSKSTSIARALLAAELSGASDSSTRAFAG